MLLDKNGIAEVLNISVSMVNKLMAQGMPHIKIGKAVRFEKEPVIEWIKARN